jgi:hypothetical protein
MRLLVLKLVDFEIRDALKVFLVIRQDDKSVVHGRCKEKGMNNLIQKLIAWAWAEKLSISLAFVAVVCLIGRMMFPAYFNLVLNQLSPLFMAALLVEVYLLRTRGSEKLIEVHKKLENNTDILLEIRKSLEDDAKFLIFSSPQEFNAYFESRLNIARELKVLRLSSEPSSSWKCLRDTGEDISPSFRKIITTFINKGGRYHIMISVSNNKECYEWLYDDLKEYRSKKHTVSILGKASISSFYLRGEMIIDDNEIVFGGGDANFWAHMNISYAVLKSRHAVTFFNENFSYLDNHCILRGSGIDEGFVERIRQASITGNLVVH